MFIGSLVHNMIRIRRMYNCEHEWMPLKDPKEAKMQDPELPPLCVPFYYDPNEPEEQCVRCGVIVTAEGKKNLAKETADYKARNGALWPG